MVLRTRIRLGEGKGQPDPEKPKKEEVKTKTKTVQYDAVDKKNIIKDMIEAYCVARDLRLNAEKMAKEIQEKEDALEQELWDTMEAWGFKSIVTEDNGTISRTFTRLFNITNFQHFREWALRDDRYDLVRQEAHRRNLRDYCQRLMKEGKPEAIPPGVEMLIRKVIHVRGRRGFDGSETE